MPSVSRLVRRGGVFYFRMAVPRHLATRLQRSEVKVSLRTNDPLAARVKTRLLSNAFELLFKGLPTMPHVTTAMIDERVRGYFQACLNQSLEHAQLLPTDPFNDIGDEVAGLRESIEQMRTQLAGQSFGPAVRHDATDILHSLREGAPDLDALQYTCGTVLRAKIENARILAAQLSGRYEETAPKDPLFFGMAPSGLPPIQGEPEPVTPQTVNFKAIGERYLAFKAKSGWAKKTDADARRVLGLAYEVIGADRPIRSIGTEDVKAFRDLISSLPPNYMKGAGKGGLTAKQASEANSSGQTISLQTQEKTLRFFKAVLAWAADEGYLEKPPGLKVKIAGVGKLKSLDSRLPYSATQLEAIFTSPLFVGHKSPSRRATPGLLVTRDGKFWTPLIALYSGMRMGEIVQLLASDVRQENGIWYFDVSKGEGEDKKIKTLSSIRRIPVHRVLIEAGLLDRLNDAKAKARLFPDIERGSDGYYSHNFSKWWGRYAREVGFHAPKTAFHSFRHNFKDALQTTEVPEPFAKALMGHADDSVHARYGSGPSLSVLKANIDKVAYPIKAQLGREPAASL